MEALSQSDAATRESPFEHLGDIVGMHVVHGLEQQYDAFHRAGRDDASALPLAEEGELPTGEELGAVHDSSAHSVET